MRNALCTAVYACLFGMVYGQELTPFDTIAYGGTTYELVTATPLDDLGMTDTSDIESMRRLAAEQGLAFCPMELAEPIIAKALHKDIQAYLAMEPFPDTTKSKDVLYIYSVRPWFPHKEKKMATVPAGLVEPGSRSILGLLTRSNLPFIFIRKQRAPE